MRHRIRTVGAVPTQFELRYGVQAPYSYQTVSPVVAIIAPTDPVSTISAPSVLEKVAYDKRAIDGRQYAGGSQDFDESAPYEEGQIAVDHWGDIEPAADEILNAEATGSILGDLFNRNMIQPEVAVCPDGTTYDPTNMYINHPCFSRGIVDPNRPDRVGNLEGQCPAGYGQSSSDGWCYRNDLVSARTGELSPDRDVMQVSDDLGQDGGAQQEGGIPWGAIGLGLLFLL